MSLYLQRMMMAPGQDNIPPGKPILEINPAHPLVVHLKNETDEQKFTECTNLLFEQAFHGSNTGSNPVGDAICINWISNKVNCSKTPI